jgi:hypothetical protein
LLRDPREKEEEKRQDANPLRLRHLFLISFRNLSYSLSLLFLNIAQAALAGASQ